MALSWPELNWAYFKCSTCEQSTHILLKKDKVATVNFIGAPGPDWEINESVSVPNLEVRVDPNGTYLSPKLLYKKENLLLC